jgi:hypothetical protein
MVPLVNYMFQAILPNDIILEISYFFFEFEKKRFEQSAIFVFFALILMK